MGSARDEELRTLAQSDDPDVAKRARLYPRWEVAAWVRRGLRPQLLEAVVRSNASLAFAAEWQVFGTTKAGGSR